MARLIELGELKSYLGVAVTDCRYDITLAAIADRASAAVEEYVMEPVLRATRDHLFIGDGCTSVRLPYRRVNSIVSVRRAARFDEAAEVLGPGTYLLVPTPAGYTIERGEPWERCTLYAVTLDMGYDTVPATVREAVLSVAATIVARSSIPGLGRSRAGVRRQVEPVRDAEPADDGTVPIGVVLPLPVAPKLNVDQRALLAPYRTMEALW